MGTDLSAEHGSHYSRRDFIGMSAAALAALALAEVPGCKTADPRIPLIDYSGPVRLTNANIINVITGEIISDGTLTLQNGVIASVSPGAAPKGAGSVIDCKGAYVVPGLIDAHCHTTLQSCSTVNALYVSRYLKQLRNNFPAQIEAGVTTVRDMGSFPKLIHKYIKEIKKGSLTGPRVVHCNAFANVDGGHPEMTPTDFSALGNLTIPFTGNVTLRIRDLKDLKEKIPENITPDASFVKLTMDDRSLLCGRGKIPVYSAPEMDAVFDIAARQERPVSAHVLMSYGFNRSLGYPMHSVEHLVSDAYLTDKQIAKMMKKNLAIVPTAIVGHFTAFKGAFDQLPREFQTEFIENELAIRDRYIHSEEYRPYDPVLHKFNLESIGWMKDPGCAQCSANKKFIMNPALSFGCMLYGYANLKKMRDAGVLIGCGTDAGVPFSYHGKLYHELELLSRIGFSNLEVLRSATYNNAKILRREDTIGTLEEGKYADCVLLKENPLKDIKAFRRPLLVMKEGRVQFSRKKLSGAGGGTGRGSIHFEL